MKSRVSIASRLFALVVFSGCASTEVVDREILVTENIPRPNHIWVYDFVATPTDVPADSDINGQYSQHRTPQTAEQVETGRQIGAEIAAHLVAEIRAMGLPAERSSSRTTPETNDLLIRGYLLSIDKGSAVERVAIGFGSGASELRVAAEGYQVTDLGLRKLGSGTVAAGGNKMPGVAAPAALAVATANPIGLMVSGGMKVYGETSGKSGIEGRAETVAKEIAEQIKPRFEEQGWVE